MVAQPLASIGLMYSSEFVLVIAMFFSIFCGFDHVSLNRFHSLEVVGRVSETQL